MFFFSFCPSCGLSKKKKKKATDSKHAEENEDPDNTYGVIQSPENVTDGKPAGVSFRSNGKNRSLISTRYSQPPPDAHRAPSNSRKSVPSSSRELPSLPAFTATVGNNLSGIPHIDDSNQAMYESLDPDDESVSDPVYSKVEENAAGPSGVNQKQYDYPIFSKQNRAKAKKTSTEDPLYQSASQIYTAGSEDPYSSIVSEGKNDDSSSIYDVGYAKVNDKSTSSRAETHLTPKPTVIPIPKNLDHLYSKIKRDPTRGHQRSSSPPPGPSGSMPNGMARTEATTLPNTRIVPIVMSNSTARQENESGSGSIVGSDISREPSYRYITVRESIDMVRERLNRQQQEQMQKSTSSSAPVREHYYSTIANEYESVADSPVPGASSSQSVPSLPPSGASAQRFSVSRFPAPPTQSSSTSTLDPLNLNVGSPDSPPKPPTSPIPDRYGSRPKLTSSSNSDTPRSVTDCVVDDVVTVIAGILGEDGAATQMVEDGIRMGSELMSSRLARPAQSSSSTRRCQTTQTSEIPFRRSGIPVAQVNRTNSSSCQDISTQTTTERRASTSNLSAGSGSQIPKKGSRTAMSKSMPMPAAQDYVSPVDLGPHRNWPLCKPPPNNS